MDYFLLAFLAKRNDISLNIAWPSQIFSLDYYYDYSGTGLTLLLRF
jgi:hypothetical protein